MEPAIRGARTQSGIGCSPGRRSRITAAQKSELRVRCGPTSCSSPAAGNGIFGCRDRAPKSPLKCANVGRDQNPRSEWPEIPAETPYSESYRKRAVCEDWMVEVVGHKLKTHHPVIEPVSDIRVGNGIFRCRDGGSRSAFRLTRRRGRTRKSPLFTGQMRVSPAEF